MRTLPPAALVVALLSASSSARAGAWYARDATALGVAATDEVTAVALSPLEGDGFFVSWDAGGSLLHIHPLAHGLSAGPTAGAPLSPATASSLRPTMAFSGGTFVISGNGDRVLRGHVGATAFVSVAGNTTAVPVRSVAADPAIAGRMLAVWSYPALYNLTYSADAFATAVTSFSHRATSPTLANLLAPLALWGGAGVVVSDDVVPTIWVKDDVSLPSDWAGWTGQPAGVSASAAVAANDAGRFLVAGTGGMTVLVDDTTGSTAPADCTQAATPDFTSAASLGADFVLGDADGFVHQVAFGAGCAQTWSAPRDSGLGGPIRALSVRGPHEIVLFGEDGAGAPRFAWRNRPPLAPGVTGGGDVDDDSVETVTATANDPDVTAGGDDPQTFAWSCDPALSATGTATGTVTITTPSLCVDAAQPTRRTDLKCTVTTTDSDGEVSPSMDANFSVLPVDGELPTVSGVVGLTDDAIVPAGTDLSLLAEADDACPYEATWTVRQEVSGSVISSQTLAWDTPLAFTAVTQGADQLTWYTLELTVTDTAGNVGVLGPFRFGVGLPQPPLDVSLSCPASVEAGAAGTATAVPAATSGLVLDYAWELSGAASIADAAPTDDTLTFQTDACDGGGEAAVRMQPHGLFEDGAWQSCTVALLEPPDPAPPALAFAEGPALDVALGARPVEVLVHPVVTACASHDVVVRWDVSAVPAGIRPAGVDAAGTLTLSRAAPLRMVIGPSLFSALHGMVVPVRATVVDERTALASDAVEVLVRFGADAALTATAGLDAHLQLETVGPLADGDLVTITGTIDTDAAVALPGLSLVLAGDGLVTVPGSVVTESACGARADVVHQGADAQVTLEGVSATCSIEVRLVARRGFGAGGLTVRDCAWGGARTPLARCTGALAPTAPPALSCAGAGDAPLVLVLLAALGRRRRR